MRSAEGRQSSGRRCRRRDLSSLLGGHELGLTWNAVIDQGEGHQSDRGAGSDQLVGREPGPADRTQRDRPLDVEWHHRRTVDDHRPGPAGTASPEHAPDRRSRGHDAECTRYGHGFAVIGARGGIRTLTLPKEKGGLSPPRLPVSPPGLVVDSRAPDGRIGRASRVIPCDVPRSHGVRSTAGERREGVGAGSRVPLGHLRRHPHRLSRHRGEPLVVDRGDRDRSQHRSRSGRGAVR